MLLLKISTNDWTNATHDQRELSVCKDLGMKVRVLAKGGKGDKGKIDIVDGFEVHRVTSRPLKSVPISMNRVISVFLWAKYARNIHPDIISGHDLSGLIIGWISTWFIKKDKKPKLIYDSHELQIGINKKRNRIQILIVKYLEKCMINKSAFTIVVNDSIADELVKMYHLKKRPVVIRNIPYKWNIDLKVCSEVREELLFQLDMLHEND